jgi:hypothetical protein
MRRTIAVYMQVRHCTPSWASWILATSSCHISTTSIWILPSYCTLLFPKWPFLTMFSNHNLVSSSCFSTPITCPVHLVRLVLTAITIPSTYSWRRLLRTENITSQISLSSLKEYSEVRKISGAFSIDLKRWSSFVDYSWRTKEREHYGTVTRYIHIWTSKETNGHLKAFLDMKKQ